MSEEKREKTIKNPGNRKKPKKNLEKGIRKGKKEKGREDR